MERSARAVLLAALLAAGPATLADPTATPTLPADAEPGEEIVITATRSPRSIRQVPAAVTVLRRADLERSPTKTMDELLRIDPSFTLFRRSSSLAADPSSQGVKLRNVGGTAISRALVLIDGIPANDSFGGWVAWRSVPRLGLERLEVVPGGGSALYGNYALGGVIQAFSRPIEPLDLDVASEVGSHGTALFAARASDRRGPVGGALEGELFTSDGYRVAAPCPALGASEQCRGAVDGATPSKHATVRGRVEVSPSPGLAFDLRGGYFYEDFDGGTTFTTARVRRFEYAGGAHLDGTAGAFDLSLFGHHGDFGQDRTRVIAVGADPRGSEARSAHQRVPTDDVGASATWRSAPLPLAGSHSLSAGVDGRWIDGRTYEDLFPPAVGPSSTVARDAGGQQRLYGAFVQDLWDLTPALGASAAVRYDRWENRSGSVVERTASGSASRTAFGLRTGGEVSPKVGLRARLGDALSLRAAAYRSFRAPTLDELYRSFQVGTTRTLANAGLTPERMWGGEAGVDVGAPRGPSLRLTAFWNALRDPIVNATLDAGTRQRQNLGAARIQGLQADAAWGFARGWSANAAYTLAATRVTEAPPVAGRSIVGNELPQAPKHLATGSVSWDDPRLAGASVQVRYLGVQYEDDLNDRPMGEAVLLDVSAAWHATRRLDLFVAVENVLDRSYVVGRAGLDTVGQPRFVHGGLRIRGGR